MPLDRVAYDDDFFRWTQEQAELLRAGKLEDIDLENLAEEIESVGRRDRRELNERLENLLIELLKWRVETGAQCGNWRSAICTQRRQIELILRDSPSLRQHLSQQVQEAYCDAKARVIEALGLLRPDFPNECPYTLEQILSEDFLPE
jgi:hypothetical protein